MISNSEPWGLKTAWVVTWQNVDIIKPIVQDCTGAARFLHIDFYADGNFHCGTYTGVRASRLAQQAVHKHCKPLYVFANQKAWPTAGNLIKRCIEG